MNSSIKATLTAKIILELTENEAKALVRLACYDHKNIVEHLNKMCHGFDPNESGRRGLISLLESSRALGLQLKEIEEIRKTRNVAIS